MTIKLSKFLNNGKSSTSSSGGTTGSAVRYDIPNQDLTAEEQSNARQNINVISTEDSLIYSLLL